MATGELHPLRGVRQGKPIVHVLLREQGVHGADIGLGVDVVRADVVTARLGEGQVELELAHPEGKRVFGQVHEAPDVDELQVAVAQPAVGVGAGDADVVVHPEGNVAAEIARRKDAEETGLEVGAGNKTRSRRGDASAGEVAAIRANHLEVVVHAQPDRRLTGDRARPDGLGPEFGLRRSAQQHRRDLQHRLVIGGELEPRVLEGLAKIVELGEIDVAGAARGVVLP